MDSYTTEITLLQIQSETYFLLNASSLLRATWREKIHIIIQGRLYETQTRLSMIDLQYTKFMMSYRNKTRSNIICLHRSHPADVSLHRHLTVSAVRRTLHSIMKRYYCSVCSQFDD